MYIVIFEHKGTVFFPKLGIFCIISVRQKVITFFNICKHLIFNHLQISYKKNSKKNKKKIRRIKKMRTFAPF